MSREVYGERRQSRALVRVARIFWHLTLWVDDLFWPNQWRLWKENPNYLWLFDYLWVLFCLRQMWMKCFFSLCNRKHILKGTDKTWIQMVFGLIFVLKKEIVVNIFTLLEVSEGNMSITYISQLKVQGLHMWTILPRNRWFYGTGPAWATWFRMLTSADISATQYIKISLTQFQECCFFTFCLRFWLILVQHFH